MGATVSEVALLLYENVAALDAETLREAHADPLGKIRCTLVREPAQRQPRYSRDTTPR
jgi:hypothetical protein